MKKLKIIFILLFLIFASSVHALDVPYLMGHVNDYAHLLSSQSISGLEQTLKDYELATGDQVVLLTITSLEDEVLEDYSMKVVEKWKLGQKEKNNGVLLLVSQQDRKLRIEVGYGLEDKLTDALSAQIIQNLIVPQFKQGNYDQGLSLGVNAIIRVLRGEVSDKDFSSSQNRDSIPGFVIFLFVVLFIIFKVLVNTRRLLGGNYHTFSGGGGFGGGGGFSGGGGSFGGGGSSGRW